MKSMQSKEENNFLWFLTFVKQQHSKKKKKEIINEYPQSVKLLVWEKSNLYFYLFTLIKLINLTSLKNSAFYRIQV